MSKTRRLLREEITYSTAKNKESNVLHQLGYPGQKDRFFSLLESKQSCIRAIVAHHLNLRSTNACRVADVSEWLHGSYNVCIPVEILEWDQKQQPGDRVLVRFPLPYRVGEDYRPGNGDEKVRCEAGTYAWLQENCPDVPIPRLYGFSMATGETFTRTENLPILSRLIQSLRRRALRAFGYSIPSRYVPHWRRTGKVEDDRLDIGYLLIEYVEGVRGKMLSSSWALKRDESKLRTNLFRDLSRIYLSLFKAPLPRIGSFIIDNNGFLRLENRPLYVGIQELENEHISTDIPRDYTYSTVDAYVVDTLQFHDSRLRSQPNAINDLMDYIYQTSALTTMRAIFPLFYRRELRRGPFIFSLTDLHPSNIFVDENWHVTSLVDLEWGCSLPIEMIHPPHWLTSMAVDQIVSDKYNKSRLEFMDVLSAEEGQLQRCTRGEQTHTPLRLSDIMGTAWSMGTFWYSLALSSPSGLFTIFDKELQPIFTKKCPDHDAFHQVMPWYWAQDIVTTSTSKLADKKAYDIQLQREFEGHGGSAQGAG